MSRGNRRGVAGAADEFEYVRSEAVINKDDPDEVVKYLLNYRKRDNQKHYGFK